MHDVPAVSVVVPTHDRVDRLGRTIASLLAQSQTDWEAIIVDDASHADVAAIVVSFDDARLRVVRREQNGGVAAAENTGVAHCTGRYIAFLHSDDEWLPSRLSRTVPVLDAAGSDVGAVECGHETVLADRVVTRTPYLEGATDRSLLSYRAGCHIAPLLLRRETVIGFDEALRHAEDRDFLIRVLRRTSIVFVREPLVRIHKEEPGLRDGDKRDTYRYLMAKYGAELAVDRELHASWWLRLARAAARADDGALAREAVRRGVALHPTRVRRWPLWVATYLPTRLVAPSVRRYEQAAVRRSRVP